MCASRSAPVRATPPLKKEQETVRLLMAQWEALAAGDLGQA